MTCGMPKTSLISTSIAALVLTTGALLAQDSPATKRLKARFPEYEKKITKVAPDVYVANGYTVSSTAMIVGDDGVVIVDPGQAVAGSREIRAEFKKIANKPIKAVIYTHGHGDHTGGARAFVDEGAGVQVWARSNYGSEPARNQATGIRGARPANTQGFDLPKEQRVGIGIAMPPDRRPAGNMMSDGMRGRPGQGAGRPGARPGGGGPRRPPAVPPTHKFSEERRKLTIAGIELELVAAPGETDDQLYVWYPAERVVFAGDNLYRSWPNVYPLRGTARRSVRDWIASYTKMIDEDPRHAVGGHSTPFVGNGKEIITAHRDALKYVYDETIKGAQEYKTPDELVATIKLPEKWAKLDHLGDYYGSVEGTIRDIYAQDLGWFDGDPLTLHRESPKTQSQRMAQLAGGVDALMKKARAALKKDDPLGAAQLAQHAMRLRPDDPAPKLLMADALAIVGERTFNAPARNYTLAYSNRLRKEAEGK